MARLHSDGYLSGSTMGFESFGDLTRSSEDDHFVSENEASWKRMSYLHSKDVLHGDLKVGNLTAILLECCS